MPTKTHTFAVVYLCRKVNPIWKSRAFLDSYFKSDPGPDYPLYFLQKGYAPGEVCDALKELPASQRDRVRLLCITDDGMDKQAYAKACRQITAFSHLLIMNSNAIILGQGWEKLYQTALDETDGRDLIGATGSWEAMTSLGVRFPNPHIRTSAFLVDRLRFLDSYGPVERLTKRDSYFMESGPDSLTRHYIAAGDRALVLDRHGRLHEVADWATSHTYRAGNQENLLVGDLKTFRFFYLLKRNRLEISQRCWGDQKSATGGSWLTWLPYRIWYKHLYLGYRFRWLMRLTQRFRPVR